MKNKTTIRNILKRDAYSLQDVRAALEPEDYLWGLIAGVAVLIGIVATAGGF